MTDLGLALVWLAVQDVLVAGPVVWIQARFGRRSPAAGAWVAAVGLGLMLLLPLALVWPRSTGAMPTPAVGPGRLSLAAPEGAAVAKPAPTPGPIRLPSGWLRVPQRAWAGVERRVAPAVDRWRPAARFVAPTVGAMVGLGLLRLLGGLIAVEVWRRRGHAVIDAGLLAELDALRAGLGCRHHRPVAVREVAGLGAPAVAGWWRPVIFVPGDWRAWSAADRRAVLAHELAHLARGDYAAGLLGHLAQAVHAHHPAVTWLMARMVRDQEAAADRAAAGVAGGRSAYRVALARLALRMDDEARSPGWLARAFLPRRGGLVRRMALLTQEETTVTTWTRSRKLLVVATLATLTLGVGSLPDPIHADEAPPVPTPVAATTAAPATPFDPTRVCLGTDLDGVVAIRPATLARLAGDARLAGALDSLVSNLLLEFVVSANLNTSRTKPANLSMRDVEWASTGFRFDREPVPDPKTGRQLHRIIFEGPVVRTVAPFDWLGYLRQWGFTPTEVRDPHGIYHKGMVERMPYAFYLPDDRTLVFGSEDRVRAVMDPATRNSPLLDGPDWEQARQGWLAYTLANRGGKLNRVFRKQGTEDDAILPLVTDVDRWTIHAPVADPTAFRAIARAAGEPAAAGLVAKIGVLRTLGLAAIAAGTTDIDPAFTLPRTLLTNLEARQDGTSARLETRASDMMAQVVALAISGQKEMDEAIQASARAKEWERAKDGPEAVAARARYEQELKRFEAQEKIYQQQEEEFRAGRRKLRPVGPIRPVPPPPILLPQ